MRLSIPVKRHFSIERRKYGFSVYAHCPICDSEVKVGEWSVSEQEKYDATVKAELDQLEEMWESDKEGYTEKCLNRSRH